jgi:hypothetical protein
MCGTVKNMLPMCIVSKEKDFSVGWACKSKVRNQIWIENLDKKVKLSLK